MVLFDLIADKNRFNEYADEITDNSSETDTGKALRAIYDLREDENFGTDDFSLDKHPSIPPGILSHMNADLLITKKITDMTYPDTFLLYNIQSYFHRGMATFLAMENWKKYGRIYSVDADFYNELAQTEKTECDFSVFGKIPFSSFYIDLSNIPIMSTRHYNNVQGVLVSVISEDMVYMSIIDGNNTEYNPLWCYAGKSSSIPFPAEWQKFYRGKCRFVDFMLARGKAKGKIKRTSAVEDLGWNVIPGGVVEAVDMHSPVAVKIVMFVIQFLYFLHSKTDDIVENRPATQKYSADKRLRPMQTTVTQWDVGVRYGNKIRTIDRKQKLYGNVTGISPVANADRNRPRPYVRGAHWHKYWCGSGESKHIEVRWLTPVFCNGDVDSIIATISSVGSGDVLGTEGEELVRAYLEKYKVRFEREFRVEIKGHVRRFDFAVQYGGKLMFIEFDGIQHFKPVDLFGGEEGFRDRRKSDWDKNRYAEKNRIPLLRIRYDQKDRVPELVDWLFEKKAKKSYNPFISNSEYYMPIM